MPDNGFIWNSDFGRKPKKDQTTDPLGFRGKTSRIISDAEDTLRERRETDNAIGETARQLAKPVPIPEVPAIKSQPLPSIQPEPEKTDKADTDGNRFQYKSKAYGISIDETAKRDREYEDNLRMDSGNEGYILPPIPQSAGKNESTPDERQKLQENAANEGFTTGDSESYRQLEAESQRRIENLTAFLGTFLDGNEKEERFANGLPAPGEEHKSILGMYVDSKKKSDSARQEDWGQGIKDLGKSPYGQGVMDIYHSGAAGLNDMANGMLRGGQMVEPYVKRHYKYPLNIPTYTDPDTRTEYQYDSTGHALYKARKHFMDWSRQHDEARSQDFKDASITDPGYLGVKGAGKGIHDVGGILLSTYILGKMGTGGDAAAIALAALDSKGKSYDDHLKPYMERSEEEMWKSPVYQQMRKDGLTDEEAKFAIGDRHARMDSDMAAVGGAVKALVSSILTGVTRDGKENMILKGTQDYATEFGTDNIFDIDLDKLRELFIGNSKNNRQ